MQMLTAEFPPTSGDATLACFSVTNEPHKIRRHIGYCPQFDAHFPNLTGREHVELYASIKGIPKDMISEAVTEKLEEVGLSETDSDRLSSDYSGGMKRRLSLACATIGQPQIVFLDECSTGVDPVARREIWKLVSDMVAAPGLPRAEKPSVILTTHSMEECEALCPRIGIMANGRLRCLGSAQHLKNKFGQGFQAEMRVKTVHPYDDDYQFTRDMLENFKPWCSDDPPADEIFYDLQECLTALKRFTGDDSLASLVDAGNEIGHTIWSDTNLPAGVSLTALAEFATNEIRMKKLEVFLDEHFPKYVLRERQDSKARYEIDCEGIKISQIFARIEENKSALNLADYSVSQTSLEQVFNMHAAEAEKLKEGRNDR
jgi:ABC-type multidrug transport system ATPase subunit